MLSIRCDSSLALAGLLLYASDAIEAIGNQGTRASYTFATGTVRQFILSPTDEPTVEGERLPRFVQHIQRTCIAPNCEGTVWTIL